MQSSQSHAESVTARFLINAETGIFNICTNIFRSINICLSFGFVLLSLSSKAWGLPEKIIPGHSYYSNEYLENDGCYDLGEEKNLEEVYQNYNYYEAQYNINQQVIIFKAYKQGELEWKMTCDYRAGRLSKTITEFPGQPVSIKNY
ncbi:MAG: hypothetical protein HQM11_09535 [SAR324 cluster bacterium]|nr:hypothetical protein [SAR324 cluster bacterium]